MHALMALPPADALALTGALDDAAELDVAGALAELLAAGGVLLAELVLGVLDLLEQAASASATVRPPAPEPMTTASTSFAVAKNAISHQHCVI